MEKKTKEPLHHIAARIQRQCRCNLVETISPVCRELGIMLLSDYLILPEEGLLFPFIPLASIYGTLVTSDDVYILCENGVFHHFDRETRRHRVAFFNDSDDDLYNSLLN